MKVNELKEERFQTNIITLSEIGSIFNTKEYKIGDFYKENLEKVKERFGNRETDYFSYEDGIIVLNSQH